MIASSKFATWVSKASREFEQASFSNIIPIFTNLSIFSQMLRDKNESESPELHCKFKSFDEVIESQYFRIMHCVCLQEVDSRLGKDPAENDLVVLICPDEHTTEVFGVIEEVEKTPLRDDDGKQGRQEGGRGGERSRALASKAFPSSSGGLEGTVTNTALRGCTPKPSLGPVPIDHSRARAGSQRP